eukprot:TRINITY_DN595_c0_g1_i1.p5 TRINITY_DN595_c0_g1~~TRINITY_DN595_c0_g1_i1.p5  ORF type:complete len:142 (+),score=11.28 TRINITY_DN595_c0_g1_i1:1002-1427(+)
MGGAWTTACSRRALLCLQPTRTEVLNQVVAGGGPRRALMVAATSTMQDAADYVRQPSPRGIAPQTIQEAVVHYSLRMLEMDVRKACPQAIRLRVRGARMPLQDFASSGYSRWTHLSAREFCHAVRYRWFLSNICGGRMVLR